MMPRLMRFFVLLGVVSLLAAVEVNLSSEASRVTEGQSIIVKVVRASTVGSQDVDVTVGTGATLSANVVTFVPGENEKTVTLTAANDEIINGSRQVAVAVGTAHNVLPGATGTITVDLVDDEIVVSLQAVDLNAAEQVGTPLSAAPWEDTNPAVFRVVLVPELARTDPIQVQIRVGGTAAFEPGLGTSKARYRLFYQLPGGSLIPVTPATGMDVLAVTLASTQNTCDIMIYPHDAIDLDDPYTPDPPDKNDNADDWDWIDTAIQGAETVTLSLPLSSSSYTIGTTNTLTATIADDDNSTTGVSAVDATEAGQAGSFRVNMFSAFPRDIQVPYTVSLVSPSGITASDFFTAFTGTATLVANTTQVDIPITPVVSAASKASTADVRLAFTLLQSSDYLASGIITAQAIIRDRQGVARIEADALQVVEGSTAVATIDLERDPGHTGSALVRFRLGGTIAAADISTVTGSDGLTVLSYDATAMTGVAQIAASDTDGKLNIQTASDTLQESTETLTVTLERGETASVADNASSVSFALADNTATVGVTVAATARESVAGTDVVFTVRRAVNSGVALTVPFAMSGTLSASEYDVVTNTNLTFNGTTGVITLPGGTQQIEVVCTVSDDETPETDETLILTLDNTGQTFRLDPAAATCTINDDEPTISLTSVAPLDRHEGEGARTITISYPAPALTRAVEVELGLGGTAVLDTDYAVSGGVVSGTTVTVTIPANERSATLTITPTVEEADLGTRTVTVSLLTPTDATYRAGTGSPLTLGITDGLPTATIAAVADAVEGVAVHCYRVTLSFAPSAAVTVNVAFQTGTGLAGASDLDNPPTTVTIAANSTSADVIVTAANDSAASENEILRFAIASGTGYAVGATASADVRIHDAFAADAVRVLGEPATLDAAVGTTVVYRPRVSLPAGITAARTSTTVSAGATLVQLSPDSETDTLRLEVSLPIAATASGHQEVQVTTIVDVDGDGTFDDAADRTARQSFLIYAVPTGSAPQ